MLPKKENIMEMGLTDKLAIIGLIDESIRQRSLRHQKVADLFENLGELLNKTISGSKLFFTKEFSETNPFHSIEITADDGTQLGKLHMLYLKKPVQSYYLVYVEVQFPYRKKGLGTKIIHYFNKFLEDKGAIGILDNVIPKNDPAYDIYTNNGWLPASELIISELVTEGGEYMLYIPKRITLENPRDIFNRLLFHINRKKAYIHMRENESMVKKTIEEFLQVYKALTLYFADELRSNTHTPLMRYMFTRFMTKLISFRRRISELIGYTGGESMELIRISDAVKSIPMQSYAPRGMTGNPDLIYGHMRLFNALPGGLRRQPARFIESLPNYRRPSYVSWLTQMGLSPEHRLTLGDLLEIGFDPTRLKEFQDQDKRYIFERMQTRHVSRLVQRTDALLQLLEPLKEANLDGTMMSVNPPLMILTDGGNAYVLRQKVEGIHWDEAMEQIQTNPLFLKWSGHIDLEGLLKRTIKRAYEHVEYLMGKELPFDHFTYFVSWNLKTNQPKVLVDFHRTFFERVWVS